MDNFEQVWVGAIAMMAAASSLVVLGLDSYFARKRHSKLRAAATHRHTVDPILGNEQPGVVGRAIDWFGRQFIRPSALVNAESLLDKTGTHTWLTPLRHVAISWLLAPVGLLIGWQAAGDRSNDMRLALGLAVGLLMSRLPNMWLKRKAAARADEVTRSLPNVLDQIAISVGAGLGLDAAMTRVGGRTQGVLGEEISRTMQDVRIGVDRPIALLGLATRTDSDNVYRLVNALLQGLDTGMPLSPILDSQAHELRRQRRADAEERAHKLSVKLTFPTAACILPALMIVVLGPAIINVVNSGL